MPSVPGIPPALLVLVAGAGVAALWAALLAASRLPAGRHRTAWRLWSAALALDIAAALVGLFAHRAADAQVTGTVDVLLALSATLAALGVVTRLPARAVVFTHLMLDQVPLVLAAVAVASVTYGDGVYDSPAHIASHVIGPAAFTILASICLEGIRYVGGRSAPLSARLISYGYLLTAAAGISPAFVSNPATLGYPRTAAWIAGLASIGVGALLRARSSAEAADYRARPDRISGWSWGALAGVVVLFLLVVLNRGADDGFRQVAAVVAFTAFAARSTIARREGGHLLVDLHAAEGRFRTLVEQIPLAIYTDALDESSTTQYISPAIEQLLGYTRDEVEQNPEWFPQVLHPEDRRWVLDTMTEWHAHQGQWEQEFRMIAKDGSIRWVRDRAVVVHDDQGAPLHVQGYMQDVTARKRAEADLRESERRYRDTLEGVNLLALALDCDGVVTFCNDHVCDVTGWSRSELVGRNWYETVGPIEREDEFLQAVRDDDLEDGSEERLRTRTGGDKVILWWDTVSRDDTGAIIGVNSIGQDITERRNAEARLEFLRRHDDLTGLPNRISFTERLGEAIGHAGRRDRAVGVLFVNLENFRVVNDAYGHAVGDAVLSQFAHRLREAADGATLVARHGGDEFTVLLADLTDDASSTTHTHPADVAQMAAAIGGRVRHLLGRPFVHAGHELYLSARCGTGVYPTEADGVDDLLKAAHMNVYRTPSVALQAHRTTSDGLAPRDELELIARLHHAIDRREFLLHYQPIVDLATGDITAVEALIRWQTSSGELVPPNRFIPLAERTGLIAPITQWVVQEVCAQKAAWRRRGIELEIGFNFPDVLWDRATLLNIAAVLREHGLAADDLIIEVTESAMVLDVELSSAALSVVREHGLQLAIDDFGTGYSSLARLGELPAAVLKVDRSFVQGLPHDRNAVALTTTIVQLAHRIGMGALAEGIETEEQRRFLSDLGCNLGQGFLFSRPVPVAEIEAMLDVARRAA